MPRWSVSFQEELARTLPSDVPNRSALIALGARHLEAIEETNRVMNLTRIVSAVDAAIKHIWDSVWPWRHFQNATSVLDAGTGAGFPGIPLAIVLPHVRFILAESIQKKARFVSSLVETLGLNNVSVQPVRAEELLSSRSFDLLTARAVAPISRAVPLLAAAFRNNTRALLYKGPDVEAEIEEAYSEINKRRLNVRVVERYLLPDGLGERTLVEISSGSKRAAAVAR
jgi:16S rRNA (guanine527-N7)-methyltransferase